jgi:hypothetical protein
VGLSRNSRPHSKAVQKFSDCAHNLVLKLFKTAVHPVDENVVVLICNICVRTFAYDDVTSLEFTVCFATLGRTLVRFFSNIFGASQILLYVFHYS